MKKSVLAVVLLICSHITAQQSFTVIQYDYLKTVKHAQKDIRQLLALIKQNPPMSLNHRIDIASHYLVNKHISYSTAIAQGEGDWCSAEVRHGCAHVRQDPIYRTDHLSCITMTELVLGLVHSATLTEYEHQLIKINYGIDQIVGKPADKISYYNRNNFPTADFNYVNQKTGLLKDVTTEIFPGVAKRSFAIINRARWFSIQRQAKRLRGNVRVLQEEEGPLMANRFKNHYANFYKPQRVFVHYIPKNFLIPWVHEKYLPDETKINKIPVPSVVEVVRDDRKWFVGRKNIVDFLGSGINVSHMAILYRHSFKPNQVIYQKIHCHFNHHWRKFCMVTPVICHDPVRCVKTMMLASSKAFPQGYVWSENKNTHRFFCTPKNAVPRGAKSLTSCNRVMAMPLGDYLARNSYGDYIYMDEPSILGINIQKIN